MLPIVRRTPLPFKHEIPPPYATYGANRCVSTILNSTMNVKYLLSSVASAAVLTLLTGSIGSAKAAPDTETMTLHNVVAIGGVARGGRVPFAEDAVQRLRVEGKWQTPEAGTTISLPDGSTRTWEAVTADAEGWYSGRALTGGYVSATVESPTERTWLMEASGDSTAYINGEPRAGDPYSYGYLRLPIRLHKGTNTLLFSVGRGRLRVRFLPVTAPLLWNTDDATLPDLRNGGTANEPLWATLPLINTTEKTLTGLKVQTSVNGGRVVETMLPPLPPLTVVKVGFPLMPPAALTGEQARLHVALVGPEPNLPTVEATVLLRVRSSDQTYKQTFRSAIDGSVQYFAVNPARKPSPDNALILSLHGASVEAMGQADAYSGKDWATLVAPTNRRPYGFDWEDWGRLDALEVFALAQKQFPHDPTRVFLTGHSMGGHGTWSIGSLFPDQFAVMGPSAGWISFATYTGGSPPRPNSPAAPLPNAAVTELIGRAANQYDTLAWSTNLLQEWVYIIHGDADDNVPVTEARQMRTRLVAMNHPHVEWHEEKGAGHWWDDPTTPGAECVDWRPLFARFETERLHPDEWNAVNFTTVNPAVSGANRWIRVEQQEHALMPSSVNLVWNAGEGTIIGTTQNMVTLSVVVSRLPGAAPVRSLTLDGQTLTTGESSRTAALLTFRKVAAKWQRLRSVRAEEKTPERGGPFKMAFQNRFVLVYGTVGTTEENRGSVARARFDAESFLYRGNGSPQVMADRDYDPQAFRDQNVILYGNADTNRLWNRLLSQSPIQVRRGRIQVKNERELQGANLACVFLRPKPGSETASVGVVAGTGAEGFRLTECLPYFTSGAGFPDWAIVDSGVLANRRQGVVAAGYFGNDWSISAGESAWRDTAR